MSINKFYLLLLVLFISCSKTKDISTVQKDDGKIEIVLLQINDVYEIAPLPGDDLGGLARLATLKKQLVAKNKNTLSVIAGDFLSPSVIGTLDDAKGNGIKGKHMVDVLNHAKLDIAIFGNHEFDLKEKDLQKRLNESEFDWVSSNVFHVKDEEVKPFYKIKNNEKQYIPETIIKTFTDADGTKMKVGFFAVCLDVKKQPYVKYEDVFETSRKMLSKLENENVDLIVPLTHLNIVDDELLAERIPNFPLIIGGHDHHHMAQKVGNSTITKADANAKTAYVHTIVFDKKNKKSNITSKLVTIDKNIPSDMKVEMVTENWKMIAWNDLIRRGFKPDEVVTTLTSPLDGREQTVRGSQCELGSIVTNAMKAASKYNPDVTFTNSGSMRVDDLLKGKLTQYDIIRILPYSGEIWEVEMTGRLLKKILETSVEKRTSGAYLQLRDVEYDENSKTFKVNGKLLHNGTYKVTLSDFLLKGYDYDFLIEETEGIIKIHKPNKEDKEDLRNDIRKAVIDYLKKR